MRQLWIPTRAIVIGAIAGLFVFGAPGAIFAQSANLTVSSVSSERFAFPGEAYRVDVEIANDGADPATEFSVCLVLSDNIVISIATDLVLVQSAPLTLDAGARTTLSLSPQVPAEVALGIWYLGAVVDCLGVVDESDETDNIRRRSERLRVRTAAPDFEPVQLISGDRAAAGEALLVDLRARNAGNAPGSASLRVVLSSNPGPTPLDPTVFEVTSPVPLLANEETRVVDWGQVDSTIRSGRYYLGLIADPDDDVDELFEDNNILAADAIDVVGSGLAIVTSSPPNATTTVPYRYRFDAVGGAQAYEWNLEWSAEAPDGIVFDPATAELTGTPDASGVFDFEVQVRSGALRAARDYRLLVSPAAIPLTVLSSELPPARSGSPYEVQLVAVGGEPPYAWRLPAGAPPGLLAAVTGVLGGEPLAPGAYTFSAIVTDKRNREASTALTLRVVDPASRLSITTATLPEAVVGSPYVGQVDVDGGSPPFRWSLDGAAPGLELTGGGTAQLTGTPTAAGDYPLVIEVRDQGDLVDRNAYVLRIRSEGALTVLTGAPGQPALPMGRIGEPYTGSGGGAVRLLAAPGVDLTWAVVLGRLPAGLSLVSDGAIEGTPTESGAFAFAVIVANGAGDIGRATLAVLIEPPADAVEGDSCGCRTTRAPATTTMWAWLMALALIGRRRRT